MSKWVSYRELSRTNWGPKVPSDAVGLEQLQAGALLRIADALERLADSLDPLTAPERAERGRRVREEAARAGEKQEWVHATYYPAVREVRSRLRRLLTPLPGGEAEGTLAQLTQKVVRSLEATAGGWEHGVALLEAARAFDPKSWDWSAVKMGPLTRERLERALTSPAANGAAPAGEAPC